MKAYKQQIGYNIINKIKKVDYADRFTKINQIQEYFKKVNKSIILNSLFYKNLSFQFSQKIDLTPIFFNSSSASIIKHPNIKDTFIINTRIVNYSLDKMGKSNSSGKCVTINKMSIIDKFFNEVSFKYLFPENYDAKYVGIEDIRLFNFKDEIYFIGSYYNQANNKVQIVSNKYILGEKYNPLIINPTFITSFNWEKNWVFFNNNNDEINIIYKWDPIYICKIDYNKKELNLVKEIGNLPSIFSKFRGSTNGIEYNDKIWFIVHQQNTVIYETKNYLHNFVVFDKNMNLLGYSNAFNFENKLVEFCIGMILYNNNFIITYSTLDKTTKVVVFSPEYVNSLITYI